MSASDRVGGLVSMIRDAYLSARHEAHPHELDRHDERRVRMLDGFEAAGRDAIAGFVGQLRASDKIPAWLEPIISTMESPAQAFDLSLITASLAGIVYAVVSRMIEAPLQDLVNDQWKRFQAVPLPPAEVALNELRGGIYEGHGHAEASLSGLNDERYQAILYNTGEPIAIEQALFLYRRGKLPYEGVVQVIKESRVRPEWIDSIFKLAYGPPSGGAAIDAAVRNLLTDDQARQIVSENGVDPANYEWMRAAAGRPPGAQQMLSLLRRGLVTTDQVTQAIRESDIKDKYIPAILAEVRHLLPERSVVAAFHRGGFTQAQASERLSMLGLDAEDITALLSEGTATKTAKQRELSVTMVETGYELGQLSRADAVTHLAALGYDATDAAYILDLTNAKTEHAQHTAAVNRVRGLLIGHKVNATDARTSLVNLGVDGSTADALVGLWEIEAEANVAQLTFTETKWARNNGWIDDAGFLARMAARGFTPDDAAILLAYATGTVNPVPVP